MHLLARVPHGCLFSWALVTSSGECDCEQSIQHRCLCGGGAGGREGTAVFSRDKAAFVSFYPWKQVRALKALA